MICLGLFLLLFESTFSFTTDATESSATGKIPTTSIDVNTEYDNRLVESGNEYLITEEVKKIIVDIDLLNDEVLSLENEKIRIGNAKFEKIDAYLVELEKSNKAKDIKKISDNFFSIRDQITNVFIYRQFDNSNRYLYSFYQSLNDMYSSDIYFSNVLIRRNDDILSEEEIKNLKSFISNGNLAKIQSKVIEKIEEEKKKAEEKIKNKRLRLVNLQKPIKEKTEINTLAIYIGLPLFCFTILFLFIGTQWLKLYFNSGIQAGVNNTTFPSSVLLEISTVLLVTLSVLILGLAKLLNGDVLGTLLGGISGYVLNRTRTNGTTSSSAKTNAKNITAIDNKVE